MYHIQEFVTEFSALLPETHQFLQSANLVVHDAVSQIALLGSRGLANNYRPTSDVDLSLMVNSRQLPGTEPQRANLLRSVLEITLTHWSSEVELDLAAVFDKGDCCGLRCFMTRDYDAFVIRDRGTDCFGIYKIQRGFNGYVTSGVQLKLMYPIFIIWRRL
jgi:hypothetical protein